MATASIMASLEVLEQRLAARCLAEALQAALHVPWASAARSEGLFFDFDALEEAEESLVEDGFFESADLAAVMADSYEHRTLPWKGVSSRPHEPLRRRIARLQCHRGEVARTSQGCKKSEGVGPSRAARRWHGLTAALVRREERGVLGPRRQRLVRALCRDTQQQGEGAVVLHAQGRRTREKVCCLDAEDVTEVACGLASRPQAHRRLVIEEDQQHDARSARRMLRVFDAEHTWSRMVERLLHRGGHLAKLVFSTRPIVSGCRLPALPAPVPPPSMWQAQVHEYVRGMASAPGCHVLGLGCETPQALLTLGSSERSLELLELRRAVVLRERSWRRKWTSWSAGKSLQSAFVLWKARRAALLQEGVWRQKWTSWSARKLLQKVFLPWKVLGGQRTLQRLARDAEAEFLRAVRDLGSMPPMPSMPSPPVRTRSRSGPLPGSAEEASLAAELGLDVETYQMLRELEEREIEPEDYDVLLELDKSVAPKTLAPPQLRRFPTEVYGLDPADEASADEVLVNDVAIQGCTAFGMDFWRLPFSSSDLVDEEQEERPHGSPSSASTQNAGNGDQGGALFGADFWRLPLSLADLADEELKVEPKGADVPGQAEEPAETCMVCYMEFEAGDRVRRLQPCGHLFHKACIDSWLLGSSTRCPIDNLEVCLS